MSHFFPTSHDPDGQRLTPEETRELIERLEKRRHEENTVSIEEVARAAGVPVWQVQEIVSQMRTGQSTHYAPPRPIPSSTWLKNRLWIWGLAAIAAVFMALQFYAIWIHRNPPVAVSVPDQEITILEDGTEFPYGPNTLTQGSALGIEAPGGFSYSVSANGSSAAVMGEQSEYKPVKELSKQQVERLQKELADDVVRAVDRLVASPPIGVHPVMAGAFIKTNYYPGGDPITIQLPPLDEAFPYSEDRAESRKFREELLSRLKDRWPDFTTEEP